jgi:hypothetical protein
MGTTMSVNVEVGFRKEPSEEIVSVYDVRAGIKITIEGNELTRYENEEEFDGKYSGVDIEYKGEFTHMLLSLMPVGITGLLTGSFEGTTAEGKKTVNGKKDIKFPEQEEYRYPLHE